MMTEQNFNQLADSNGKAKTDWNAVNKAVTAGILELDKVWAGVESIANCKKAHFKNVLVRGGKAKGMEELKRRTVIKYNGEGKAFVKVTA